MFNCWGFRSFFTKKHLRFYTWKFRSQNAKKARKYELFEVCIYFIAQVWWPVRELKISVHFLRLVGICRKARKYGILEQFTKIHLHCFSLTFCRLSGQTADKISDIPLYDISIWRIILGADTRVNRSHTPQKKDCANLETWHQYCDDYSLRYWYSLSWQDFQTC